MERPKSAKAQKLSCTYVRFVLQPFRVGGPWETNGPPRDSESGPLDDYGLVSAAPSAQERCAVALKRQLWPRTAMKRLWWNSPRISEAGAGRELLTSRAEELLHV